MFTKSTALPANEKKPGSSSVQSQGPSGKGAGPSTLLEARARVQAVVWPRCIMPSHFLTQFCGSLSSPYLGCQQKTQLLTLLSHKLSLKTLKMGLQDLY